MKILELKNGEKLTCGKIVCLGRNYAEHIKELGNEPNEKPVIFIKPTSALIKSGESIVYPAFSKNLHFEAELVILIGKTIKNASKEEAEESIMAYAVGLDMTLRDVQNELKAKGQPWTIAKCFDTSAVISDFVLKSDYSLTLEERISLKVNGAIKQNESLNMMIYKPIEIICYISQYMTLEAGDLLFTGTPSGVSSVNIGDTIFAEISNIGTINTEIIG